MKKRKPFTITSRIGYMTEDDWTNFCELWEDLPAEIWIDGGLAPLAKARVKRKYPKQNIVDLEVFDYNDDDLKYSLTGEGLCVSLYKPKRDVVAALKEGVSIYGDLTAKFEVNSDYMLNKRMYKMHVDDDKKKELEHIYDMKFSGNVVNVYIGYISAHIYRMDMKNNYITLIFDDSTPKDYIAALYNKTLTYKDISVHVVKDEGDFYIGHDYTQTVKKKYSYKQYDVFFVAE